MLTVALFLSIDLFGFVVVSFFPLLIFCISPELVVSSPCFLYLPLYSVWFDAIFQRLRSPLKLIGYDDSTVHVEARYPAILFKQQLTACVEKIFGLIRDNLKKELSPLLASCIQVVFLTPSWYFGDWSNVSLKLPGHILWIVVVLFLVPL